jgi:hypothetical protein
MSEANLWTRVRNAVGHRGHFARIEFNPDAGIPDVTYCVQAIEGHIELKFADAIPARENTRVFGTDGLRDSQVAWISKRIRAGGRVWIMAQVDRYLFLVPGWYCLTFNEMTFFQLGRVAAWTCGPVVKEAGWQQFLDTLVSKKAGFQYKRELDR